jgi:hypothetical protein
MLDKAFRDQGRPDQAKKANVGATGGQQQQRRERSNPGRAGSAQRTSTRTGDEGRHGADISNDEVIVATTEHKLGRR